MPASDIIDNPDLAFLSTTHLILEEFEAFLDLSGHSAPKNGLETIWLQLLVFGTGAFPD